MRIKIALMSTKGEEIKVPVNYNYLIQSFIYRNLESRLSQFLHNEGFKFEKRTFRMFVFSRLFGKYTYSPEEKILSFERTVSFYLASPHTEILERFAESIIREPEVRIFKQDLFVSSIEVMRRKIFPEEVFIKAISPITIHSTLYTGEGKKKTYYYTPFEKEFTALIERNIKKKYSAFYKRIVEGKLTIEPIKVKAGNEKVVIYKGFTIKGWMGIYRLHGSPELIAFSYYTGLGDRNPQGFGMWEEYTFPNPHRNYLDKNK